MEKAQLIKVAAELLEAEEENIVMTMDEMLKKELGLDVEVYPMPNLCVGKGTTVALNKMHILDNYGYRYQTKEEVRIK